jgi:tetratricopeptide (TPR) repeat protein
MMPDRQGQSSSHATRQSKRRWPLARLLAAPTASAGQLSAEAFASGVTAWRNCDVITARNAFEIALTHDPHNADALLGLQHESPFDLELCRRLFVNRDRLGFYASAPELTITGRMFPLRYTEHPITDADQAALAYASLLIDHDRVEEAQALFDAHQHGLTEPWRAAMAACLRFEVEDFAGARRIFAPVATDGRLHDDGPLMHGSVLLYDNDPEQALAPLAQARAHSAHAEARQRASYLLGAAFQLLGRYQAAQRMFDEVFTQSPHYADVAERLEQIARALANAPRSAYDSTPTGLAPVSAAAADSVNEEQQTDYRDPTIEQAPAAPLAADDPLAVLERSLAAGELARDPSIHDNR